MEIHFKNTHHRENEDEITSDVTALAERKILTLKKYVRDDIDVTHVYVDLGKESEAHKKGNVWRAQMNMDCNGTLYRASATAERIETAIEKSVKELETEVRKSKGRNMRIMRRSGAFLKAIMRGSRDD